MLAGMRGMVWVFLVLLAGCQSRRSEKAPAVPASSAPVAVSGTVATLPSAAPAPLQAEGSDAAGIAWTAGIVERKAARAGVATLVAVRFASHADFDRVVFEFDAGALPGFHLEYVDRPVRRCGSGDATPIDGDAWLAVVMEPARAHTDAGAATVAPRERFSKLPIVREIELTCDFEAQVAVVLGVSRPNHYRAFELAEPPRLVIDVRH
jgi:hypothetical protein